MHRLISAIGLTAMSCIQAGAADAVSPRSAKDLLRQYEDTAMADPCGVGFPLLVELVALPDFAMSLHPRRQALLLTVLAQCKADNEEFQAALGYVDRAAAADPESYAVQGTRMVLGMLADRPLSTVDAIEALSRLHPDGLRTLNPTRLRQLIDAVERADPSGDSALRVYESMQRAGLDQPDEYFGDEDLVNHARLLATRGRLDEARERLAMVTHIQALVGIRADRRFDPLRNDAQFEAKLDLAAAGARSVDRAKAEMTSYPKSLSAIYYYCEALILVNRFEEAAAQCAAALQRAIDAPADFDDRNEVEMHLAMIVGLSYYSLGRLDEGRRVFQDWIARLTDAWQRSNLRMALANFMVSEGRGAEALATLSSIETASPWEQAWIEAIRVCAALQTHDDAIANESMDYVRRHDAENEAALPHALICVGDLESLAKVMIQRVNAPQTRLAALERLQAGTTSAYDELPFMKSVRAMEAALRSRSDLRQAAEAVGRMEVLPILVRGIY